MGNRAEGFYNVAIHPRALKVSWEPLDRLRRYSKGYRSSDMPKNINTGGIISIKAQKRINNAIDWMLAQSKPKKYYSKKHKKHFHFRVNFLTLTLSAPQVHDDNVIKKKLLNNFLVQLRSKWNVKHYIWRAESQSNGNIHFHICCDKYIPWWEMRATWNKIQNNLGYIDRFEEKFGHRDPNSTDVHKVKKIRNLGGYLSKEIAKNSKGAMYTPLTFSRGKFKPCFNPSLVNQVLNENQKMYRVIQGNLWNLCEKLSQIKASCMVVYGKAREELEEIKKFFKSFVFSGDYYEVVNVPVNAWANVIKGVLWDSYQNNLQMIRSGYVQNKISFI